MTANDADERGRRLRILYAVPGHHLLSTAGPTRNVLSLAKELGQLADLTVAFRTVLEPGAAAAARARYRIEEIDPDSASEKGAPAPVDDAAIRGMGRRELLRYLGAIGRYVDARAPDFDVVLEKSWLFSGRIAVRCARQGRAAALIENIVRQEARATGAGASFLQRLQRGYLRRTLEHQMRRVPLVVAETDELKRAMQARWKLPSERIRVVGLGVDPERFHPRDQGAARAELSLPMDRTLLLYAGVFDAMHDLAPLLEGLQGLAGLHAAERWNAAPPVELHLLGDGPRRAEYKDLAARTATVVRFHGRVPHAKVPTWIAASDLCVAPYDPRTFPGGEVAYSTLKVPEFLASGRAVATVPSGHLRTLVRAGRTGYLLANEAAAWTALLRDLDREELARYGAAAAESPAAGRGWDLVARDYLDVCESLVDLARD